MNKIDRASGIEIRHLVALEAVAEERSFGRAAARLGYTQSAVSHQIRALERLVGHTLVERPGGSRRISLTEAGERLREHSRGIVARVLAAYADLDALAEGMAGSLHVGTFQSAGARILPRVLLRYRELFPTVTVHLTEAGDGSDLLRLVEEGELDVCFSFLPLPEGPFDAVSLVRDPWVLLVAPDSELAARDAPPGLAELAGLDLIAWHNRRGGRGIEAQLRAQGYEPNVILRSDDSATILGLVAAGIGAAIVPRLTAEADDTVVALDLDGAFADRVIALAWHRDRHVSAAARGFVDVAEAVCAPAVAAE